MLAPRHGQSLVSVSLQRLPRLSTLGCAQHPQVLHSVSDPTPALWRWHQGDATTAASRIHRSEREDDVLRWVRRSDETRPDV